MDRRRFVSALPTLAAGPYLGSTLGAPLVAVLSGCSSEPLTGPVDIKWDRDVCVRCSMVISDRHFAAQIRNPMKKVLKFDDFGCAVFWKEHQTWSDAEIEFWVANSADDASRGKWLDARKAFYVGGKRTPMGYGFGAVSGTVPGALGYDEARKLILAKGK
jgi:nitrous oxide reductase accessory protein NosL